MDLNVTDELMLKNLFDEAPPDRTVYMMTNLSATYNFASVTGNKALQIPANTAADGVLAVSPTMSGAKFYFNVQ
ncbi:MAG: hypothetical protein ACTJG8_07800 [Canibacter sp.]